MVSSTPGGSGFPIGLMPGALPSDQASRQTLKTTAVRLPLGHTQFAGFAMPRRAPCRSEARHIRCRRVGKGASPGCATCRASHAPLPTLSDFAVDYSPPGVDPRRANMRPLIAMLHIPMRNPISRAGNEETLFQCREKIGDLFVDGGSAGRRSV